MPARPTFHEATHTYSLGDRVIMHVTRPLVDLKGLENVPRDTLLEARERGRMADKAVMLYVDDNLNEETLDPVLAPYLEGFKKAERKYGIRVLAKQQLVYHAVYGYAGTFDLLIEMERPPVHALRGAIMTEVKCVDETTPDIGLQLAAYAEAYNHELETAKNYTAPRARHRLALRLLDTGDFEPTWFTDKTDFMSFVGCLYRLNWRIKHGYEQHESPLG